MQVYLHAGKLPLCRVSAARLTQAIRAVLLEAIAAGGSSLRDHKQPDGELGYFQHSFKVYGRESEPCPGCDCDVAKTGGYRSSRSVWRSTYSAPASKGNVRFAGEN